MTIDLDTADRFIRAIAGDDPVTFQLFDDRRKNKRPNMARIVHGTLIQRFEVLSELNKQGAGVYLCINKTDLKGRDKTNVIGLRALFIDADNGDPGDLSCMPLPSIVVKSVQGPHIYWLLNDGEPIDFFTDAQKRLSSRFGTDPVIHDLPRVMRIPGFLHCKDEPKQVTLELCEPSRRYSIAEVLRNVPEIEKPTFEPVQYVCSSPDKTYAMERARSWMALRDPAVEGSGGDHWTFITACNLVNDFDLTDGEAMDLLQEWNATCCPPWSTEELQTKIDRARKYGTSTIGGKLMQEIDRPVDNIGEVDLTDIMASFGIKNTPHNRTPIEELLHVPGLVGDLADWINKCAIKKQPILALGASIAAMSAILGRKVRTRSNLRPNLYCVGVVGSCGGKESTRNCIKDLFKEIGADKMIGAQFASGSAVEAVLAVNPSQLFLIDELGKFMESVKGDTTAGHVKAIIPMLMTIYSASSSVYHRISYADGERNSKNKPIQQPSLSLWATTVPGNLFSSASKDHIGGGFLGRLLVFQSTDNDPIGSLVDIDDCAIPKNIRDGFEHWFKAPINMNPKGNLDDSCVPRVIEMTPEAKSIFDGFEMDMRQRRKEIREKHGQNSGYDAPYGRAWATSMVLGMIRACGISLTNPVIEASDAQWGCDLVWLLTDLMWSRVMDVVAENATESNLKRVLAIIRDDPGIQKKNLTRKTQWIKSRERNEILIQLIESYQIEQSVKKPTSFWPIISDSN